VSPPDAVRADLDRIAPVSDEVWKRLQTYAGHLEHWQKTLNLVAPSTLGMLWERHILDSWQMVPLAQPRQPGPLVDLGSGAGLPGLILALAGVPDVHLVESNQRKAAFLRFVAEQTATPCTIHPQRIEALSDGLTGKAATVSARALAALPALLHLALPLCDAGTRLLFPKGRRWQDEVREAEKDYAFDLQAHESVTESEAVILELRCLTKR
jgi:16S rRNA (guanine527-N7)-methyltransferase